MCLLSRSPTIYGTPWEPERLGAKVITPSKPEWASRGFYPGYCELWGLAPSVVEVGAIVDAGRVPVVVARVAAILAVLPGLGRV